MSGSKPPVTVVNLMARPSIYADLSFEVGGIIKSMNASLGQSVPAFDFDSVYTTLGVATESFSFTPGGKGAVTTVIKPVKIDMPESLDNSADILSAVSRLELMCLRSEDVKAALDQTCALRANIYLGKHSDKSAVIAKMREYYDPSKSHSKPAYLAHLRSLASQQFNSLTAAYGSDTRPDVVTTTSSLLHSDATERIGQNNSVNTSSSDQTMTYTDYGYRIPTLEADAQNARAQISLIDEQFAQYMAGQSLPALESVFANELKAIDMDVKRLQVAFLNTILLSPITGVVTGIFKQVGEAVIAGERVIRIENNSSLLLTGVIVYPGMLSLQDKVTIKTNLFSSSTTATLPGTIVAARIDKSGDDHWEVVISCVNSDGSGNPVLPLDYVFDVGDTSVIVS
jgi:hypothetical protein